MLNSYDGNYGLVNVHIKLKRCGHQLVSPEHYFNNLGSWPSEWCVLRPQQSIL